MIEIEVKSRLSPDLREKILAEMSLRAFGEKETKDEYFDTPSFTLLRRGIFFRIREGSGVEVKYNEAGDAAAHGMCREAQFGLPLSSEEASTLNSLMASLVREWDETEESFSSIAKANRLRSYLILRKSRESYQSNHVLVHFDEVEGLGSFVEIEVILSTPSEEVDRRRELSRLVDKFNLTHIGVGYVELWLRNNMPDVYKLGKFKIES